MVSSILIFKRWHPAKSKQTSLDSTFTARAGSINDEILFQLFVHASKKLLDLVLSYTIDMFVYYIEILLVCYLSNKQAQFIWKITTLITFTKKKLLFHSFAIKMPNETMKQNVVLITEN